MVMQAGKKFTVIEAHIPDAKTAACKPEDLRHMSRDTGYQDGALRGAAEACALPGVN